VEAGKVPDEESVLKMKEALGGISDPRRQWGYLRHMLPDILVIGLCSVITKGADFEDMGDLGRDSEEWFAGFLELPHGIPGEDTFRRMFERIAPARLLECLRSWLTGSAEPGGREVCIDGKTLRGSKGGGRKAVHMVSAWVNANSLTLGQLETREKSNEITAIPELLELIDVKGDTVTVDAMGCQAEIAAKIRSKGADYVLAVKENRPTLHGEIAEYFRHLDEAKLPPLPEDIWESGLEKDHGRLERRRVRTACDIGFLSDAKKWKGLRTIVESRGERTVIGGETKVTCRYYISSRDCAAEEFCRIIRGHWSIENNLHWALDVSFGEDGCRARKDNSPKNLAVMRKMALGLLRAVDAGKGVSLRRKMRMACRNTDFLRKVLFGK